LEQLHKHSRVFGPGKKRQMSVAGSQYDGVQREIKWRGEYLP
jgi:hypothetical protein